MQELRICRIAQNKIAVYEPGGGSTEVDGETLIGRALSQQLRQTAADTAELTLIRCELLKSDIFREDIPELRPGALSLAVLRLVETLKGMKECLDENAADVNELQELQYRANRAEDLLDGVITALQQTCLPTDKDRNLAAAQTTQLATAYNHLCAVSIQRSEQLSQIVDLVGEVSPLGADKPVTAENVVAALSQLVSYYVGMHSELADEPYDEKLKRTQQLLANYREVRWHLLRRLLPEVETLQMLLNDCPQE